MPVGMPVSARTPASARQRSPIRQPPRPTTARPSETHHASYPYAASRASRQARPVGTPRSPHSKKKEARPPRSPITGSPKAADALHAAAQTMRAEEAHFQAPRSWVHKGPLLPALLDGTHPLSKAVLSHIVAALVEPIAVGGVETLVGARFDGRLVCRAWRDAGARVAAARGVLRHEGAIHRVEPWTPFCIAALPDGRLCASDTQGRQLLLLSPTGESRGVVRLHNAHGEDATLRDPRGVCVRAAGAFDAPTYSACTLMLYVADRGPKAPRICRCGLTHDGDEVLARRQFGPDSRLSDPQELALSANGATLCCTDVANMIVAVLDAIHMTWLCAIAGHVSRDGALNSLCTPYGVVMHGDEVFVAEEGAHRISVYERKYGWAGRDEGYRLARQLGRKGTAPGCFRRPRGLTIVDGAEDAPEGGREPWIIVAEAKRVQVLTLNGTPLQLLEPPNRTGTLWGLCAWWPAGLAFVTDGMHVHVLGSAQHANKRLAALAAEKAACELAEMAAAAAAAREAETAAKAAAAQAQEAAAAAAAKAERAAAEAAEAYAAQEEARAIAAQEAERRAAEVAALEAEAAREAKEAAKRAAREAASRSVKEVAARAAEEARAKKAVQAAREAKEALAEKILKAEALARAKAAQAAREARAAKEAAREAKEATRAKPMARAGGISGLGNDDNPHARWADAEDYRRKAEHEAQRTRANAQAMGSAAAEAEAFVGPKAAAEARAAAEADDRAAAAAAAAKMPHGRSAPLPASSRGPRRGYPPPAGWREATGQGSYHDFNGNGYGCGNRYGGNAYAAPPPPNPYSGGAGYAHGSRGGGGSGAHGGAHGSNEEATGGAAPYSRPASPPPWGSAWADSAPSMPPPGSAARTPWEEAPLGGRGGGGGGSGYAYQPYQRYDPYGDDEGDDDDEEEEEEEEAAAADDAAEAAGGGWFDGSSLASGWRWPWQKTDEEREREAIEREMARDRAAQQEATRARERAAEEAMRARKEEERVRQREVERRRADAEKRVQEEEAMRAQAKRPPTAEEVAAAAAEAAARASLVGTVADDENDEEAYKGARDAKSVERDLAVRQILGCTKKNLRTALGLKLACTDDEVRKHVKHLLRLLHPDYNINLALKGTKHHARIENAFKKLNELREQIDK